MKLTLEMLDAIALNHGGHGSPDDGHCLLEVVSMFANEPFGDTPECVDPVLRSFGISWNDGMHCDEEREQLKQYIVRLVGTNKGPELSRKRSWMAMDWLVRVHTAAWLTLTPALMPHANALKALPPLTCEQDLRLAMPALEKAKTEAANAWDAAWDAAGAAGGAAAWAAARAAAWDAAWAAAWAAAGAAARAAARAAAGAAAWAAAGAYSKNPPSLRA